jgi:hypothetical protein
VSHTVSQPDAGYTTGFYDGKQAEQDRIIKLLDAQYIEILEAYGVFLGRYKLDALNEAVTLIKGEK